METCSPRAALRFTVGMASRAMASLKPLTWLQSCLAAPGGRGEWKRSIYIYIYMDFHGTWIREMGLEWAQMGLNLFVNGILMGLNHTLQAFIGCSPSNNMETPLRHGNSTWFNHQYICNTKKIVLKNDGCLLVDRQCRGSYSVWLTDKATTHFGDTSIK